MSELLGQLGAAEARTALATRLAAASVQEVLSDADGKQLSLMCEPDGRQFVCRAYKPGAERSFERSLEGPQLPFAQTLAVMYEMYAAAGLTVVKSSILPAGLDTEHTKGVTVISEYIADAIPINKAPIETKKEALHGLGKLLDASIPYLPSTTAVISDMFLAAPDHTGELHPVIVDIDPRIDLKEPSFDHHNLAKTERVTDFMKMVGTMITLWEGYNSATTSELARTFIGGMREITNPILGNSRCLDALLELHMLGSGRRW